MNYFPTYGEWAQIITAIIIVAQFIQSRFNSLRIKNIETKTNGMMAKIEDAATALGNLEGRKELKAEQKISHLSEKV